MIVELHPVTAENWRALIALQVREDQRGFVASNLFSIAESQFGFEEEGHWSYHPFGVYSDGEPVGFYMYGLNPAHSRFQGFVTRLMVDEKFQGRGYGRETMKLALEIFRVDERIRAAGISYEPHNAAARSLYASLGFEETGELVGQELLAVLNLR